MLPKSHRLNKKDINRLYKKGKVFKEDFLVLRVNSNFTDHFRAAVIIPKAVANKATVRNRLKRKTMTILAPFKLEPKNIDLALFFKKEPREEEIQPALIKILTKAGIAVGTK